MAAADPKVSRSNAATAGANEERIDASSHTAALSGTQAFPMSAQVARIDHVTATASTQLDARRRWEAGAARLTSVVADLQTGGHGRLGRTWQAPEGSSLLVSTIVAIPATDAARESLGFLTMVSALAIRAAIAEATSAEALVSWPNDVVLRGEGTEARKVAGILGEFLGERDGSLWAVMGVGVNLIQSAAELAASPETAGATSLLASGALAVTPEVASESASLRDHLLASYLANLAERVALLETNQPTAVVDEMNRVSADVDAQVSVGTLDGTVEGAGRRITENGSLQIATHRGLVTVTTGQVAMFAMEGTK